jgi:hypothetical protein
LVSMLCLPSVGVCRRCLFHLLPKTSQLTFEITLVLPGSFHIIKLMYKQTDKKKMIKKCVS